MSDLNQPKCAKPQRRVNLVSYARNCRPQFGEAVHEKELLAIFRLRYEIYVEQQRKPLPSANDGLRILRDDLDDVATNFYVGNDDGEIVACGRATIGVWPQVCDGPFTLPAFNGFRPEDFYYISKVMLNPRLRSFSAIPACLPRCTGTDEQGTLRLESRTAIQSLFPFISDSAGDGSDPSLSIRLLARRSKS